MKEHSDFIVYVDESGDHSLTSIDNKYPIFVLSFCIFHKEEYTNIIVPQLKKHKFERFGHDAFVLHERDIRKQTGHFSFLHNEALKHEYYSQINDLISKTSMDIIAAVIDKKKLQKQYAHPDNPYHMALGFCLERLSCFLKQKNQESKLTHILVEARGKKEDKDLELEYWRIVKGQNQANKLNYTVDNGPFQIHFVSKIANMAGMQIADLVSRPIGRSVINPNQSNQAWDILKNKLFEGLKVFP
ncbi:DUF3800 domain-containing protein [Candidatus Nucleicultrix amoebiphila]|uniref:DUF3800 domain-containing protein n=1 Tax=Candidatus Nucleicultrix amoebiphila TaxID=1509244 RepID=UPI000A268682|nr:DUF3800 domain-containing protein [Candidatus Nucleicultrix amoebiphila]